MTCSFWLTFATFPIEVPASFIFDFGTSFKYLTCNICITDLWHFRSLLVQNTKNKLNFCYESYEDLFETFQSPCSSMKGPSSSILRSLKRILPKKRLLRFYHPIDAYISFPALRSKTPQKSSIGCAKELFLGVQWWTCHSQIVPSKVFDCLSVKFYFSN